MPEKGQNMETTKEVQQSSLPSLLQIRYLIELDRIGWKRGTVMEIAEKCGVSHPSVSRYLKSCCENGILTKKYEFTQSGSVMLERYKKLLKETEAYLERIGLSEGERQETVKTLVEHIDCATLGRIVRSDSHPQSHTVLPQVWREEPFLDEVLEWGTFPVCITIYQLGSSTGNEWKRSMADRGFERQAMLRHNKRGSWLELSIREMNARSRVDNTDMTGKLSSLKYECDGRLHSAEIRNGKVKIPLEACRFAKNSRGIIKGRVALTVTCSVGCAHMPESTALLIFWL